MFNASNKLLHVSHILETSFSLILCKLHHIGPDITLNVDKPKTVKLQDVFIIYFRFHCGCVLFYRLLFIVKISTKFPILDLPFNMHRLCLWYQALAVRY